MILVNMDMPKCCYDCPMLDDYGDYPRCRITDEQRGYTFRVRELRMPGCPLKPLESKKGIDCNELYSEWY